MSCYLEQTVTEQELMEAQPYEVLNFHRSTLSPNVTSCVCRALYTCLDAVILLWHQEDCIGFI